jgi:hypothetical protein
VLLKENINFEYVAEGLAHFEAISLQHTATHLPHAATRCDALQLTATHRNTLQQPAMLLEENIRFEYVSKGLAHFEAVLCQETVRVYEFGQRHVGCVAECVAVCVAVCV